MNTEDILLVDDDTGFLEVTRNILQGKGYSVATATSADEAISLAEQHSYNVAILDISLPDTEGTELLPVLMETLPDIVAIMLTGHSSVQNAIQSLNRGAFAYLEKPLNPEHLLSVIARGLEKQQLAFENKRLIAELEQRNRETGILLSVSQTVAQSLDPMEIINSAFEKIAQFMVVDAGHLHLLTDGRLILTGCHGLSRQIISELKELEIDETINRGLEHGTSITIDNLSEATETSLAPLAKGAYQSYAGIPLTTVGECIGIMGVASYARHHFTPGEVELLCAIGGEISMALRNAQLFEEASSARALRKLNALRTELLANVSHELRTPLAVIKGAANSLLAPDVNFDEQTQHDFLQTIDREADRLNHLIEELLVMSRLEAGSLEVKRQWHSLSELIESTKDRLYALAPKHRLRILSNGSLPMVYVDDIRIEQVLTNLVENAVKFSAEGTQITLDAQPNGNKVIVSVTDQGIGIPTQLHDKVFERFYQIKNTAFDRMSGTGLGLSICRGIIEAHEEEIWVESQPEMGATFYFSLPTN